MSERHKQSQGVLEPTLVYRLNDHGQGPELLHQVFLEQGWVLFNENEQDEDDWNLWWRTSRFRTSDYDEIQPWQRLNHYPKSTAVTKKDSLARNLKRMRAVHGPNVYNFSPIAFNLPNDYTKFVAEYTKLREKQPNKVVYWICKPADLSRGRGIFIFKDLSELQYDCNAVVQQYISNPLLISGYKFDLRIYVIVPSFNPLVIYIYKEGLVRFSTEKYDLSTLGNMYAHLTNTSINKHSPSYTTDKERVGPGCKWTLTQLRHYFHQMNIDDRIVWKKIVNIITLTLMIQAHQVPKATNCFELYGFDIMIDENLKPWLLEVNFSPALSSDCQADILVKKPMLHDLISMLNFTPKDRERSSQTPPKSKACQNYNGSNQYGYHKTGQYKSNVARLPRISSTSTTSSMVSTSNSSTHPEEEDEMDRPAIPIVPGCGLPSVQQSIPDQISVNSGRSSAASVTSAKLVPGDNGRILEYPQFHQELSFLNKDNERKMFDGEPLWDGHRKEGKLCRGEGATQKQLSANERSKSSLSVEELQCKLQHLSEESFVETTRNTSPAERKLASPTKQHILSRLSRAGSSMENSGESYEDNKSPSPDHSTKRRLSHISFTANPIAKKSALLHRQINFGTYNKVGVSSRRTAYSRPWQRSKSGPEPVLATLPSAKRKPEPQVGQFVLVFPFNETTRRCAQTSLDAKVVIRECLRVVKQSRSKTSQETKDNQVPCEDVSDVPCVWRPLKTPVEEPVS